MLFDLVPSKNLLHHPFYVLWLEGKLPPEAIQNYAKQYFYLVLYLPNWITMLHQHAHSELTKQQLQQNFQEEMGEGNGKVPHTELWLHFAEEMGVSRSEIEQVLLLPATEKTLATITSACSSSLAEGAAALYAYESQVPEIARQKIFALQQLYHIRSEKALRFFNVHAEVDKKHAAVWKAIATEYTHHTEKTQRAIQATASALWEMFDAMYDEFVPQNMRILA